MPPPSLRCAADCASPFARIALGNITRAYPNQPAHLAASLPPAIDGDYAGTHWLASFALLALTA